ncbi:MAG: OmpA family protein [Thermoanaerobaculia bacterium]
MKKCMTFCATALLVALALGGAASAAEIQLTSVLYPEKKSIDIPFTATAIGPKAATVSATVYSKSGQSDIKISWEETPPAILFSGNITDYAVWAITKDGVADYLGELGVTDPNGSRKFRTGRKDFAIIITAEAVTGTPKPSNLVVFVSGPSKKVEAKSSTFAFSGFIGEFWQKQIKPGNPSIADLPPYQAGSEPIQLIKARKLLEMAQGMKLTPGTEKSIDDAKIALSQAANTAAAGGSSKVITDYAARSASLSSEAIRKTVQTDYDAMVAAAEAKKAAEKAALQKGLATTSAQLDETTRAKAEVEALLAQVRKEKAEVEADRASVQAERDLVKAERDALAARLSGALEKIMAVRQSARGIVMDLGDVLYDVNKATLKPGARESLAKLSGVLLMLPDINIRIEGFTDSTGTAERNRVLSADRAKSVYDYLTAQGIASGRLSHAGYGPANPVADNATKEGRAKNRRVELTFAQGMIEPTPGGYTAPDAPPASAKPAAKPVAPKTKG